MFGFKRLRFYMGLHGFLESLVSCLTSSTTTLQNARVLGFSPDSGSRNQTAIASDDLRNDPGDAEEANAHADHHKKRKGPVRLLRLRV